MPAGLRAATRQGRPWWTSRSLYVLLFAVNAAVVIGFWWVSTGPQQARGPGDLLNAIGRVTGLLGTYMVLWQLLLMTRQPWLDAAFGLDRLARLHRWNGYTALGLLLAHAVFQTLGYQVVDNLGLVAQLGDFVNAYDGMLPAIAGLLLLVLVVTVSVVIARRHLRYETWYFVHLYTYLAIALAFTHELAVGADFIANRAFTVYWCLLYAAVAACLLGFRVARPLLRFHRHRFRVARLVREAPGVLSIYVEGRDLEALRAQPGQFMMWRFLDRRRWWQSHPFSLSMAPDGRHLRLTVKGIGDFTSRLSRLAPGTPVLVEGPFGVFTDRLRRAPAALLIAGGVGITPLRALLQRMVDDGVDVCLVYRCRRREDIVFKDELDQLAGRPGVRVQYVLSEQRSGRRTRAEPLRPAALRQLVPDIRTRDIYVCGPAGMVHTVLDSLQHLAVDPASVHTEAFRLAP